MLDVTGYGDSFEFAGGMLETHDMNDTNIPSFIEVRNHLSKNIKEAFPDNHKSAYVNLSLIVKTLS